MNKKQKSLEKARVALAKSEKNIKRFSANVESAEKRLLGENGKKLAVGGKMAERARNSLINAIVGVVTNEIHRKKIISFIEELEKDID